MSKRFKGKICAYCARRVATTGDHIFAREFFLEARRDNLPQAPACADCNNEKAKLEHYLTTVLPFGGRHPDASSNLASMVPKRLGKNVKLRRQLAEGHTGTTIPIDGEKLEKLFALITRGLVWYHWKVYVDDSTHVVRSFTVGPFGAQAVDGLFFNKNARNRVNENVGYGAFVYEGVQGTDDPAITSWRFLIYGGLLVNDGLSSEPLASQLVAFTCPKELDEQLCRVLGIERSDRLLGS